ncbi:MAG: ankyrin repeat domain-containing protein [Luteibacter sp.]
MTKRALFRSPSLWLSLVAVLGLASAWVASPSLRLAVRGTQPSSIARARLVDAHTYDSAWFDAARVGRTDILGALLDAGYPIDAQTSSGYTATILAAYDEQPAALEYLLRRGADACVGDRNGNTALMGALYKGEMPIARRLLKTACPIDQVNHAGETALSFAVLFGRLDIVQELVDRGADTSHRDGQGDTPYGVAEKQGNQDAMRVLRDVAP